MARGRAFHYLVDGLTAERAVILRKSLAIVADILSVEVSVGRGAVETVAVRDVEPSVRVACDVAGVTFRTRVRL